MLLQPGTYWWTASCSGCSDNNPAASGYNQESVTLGKASRPTGSKTRGQPAKDITFNADGIRPSGQGATVTCALTVRGRTRPLSFDAAASVQGDGEISLDAKARHQPGRLRPHLERSRTRWRRPSQGHGFLEVTHVT